MLFLQTTCTFFIINLLPTLTSPSAIINRPPVLRRRKPHLLIQTLSPHRIPRSTPPRMPRFRVTSTVRALGRDLELAPKAESCNLGVRGGETVFLWFFVVFALRRLSFGVRSSSGSCVGYEPWLLWILQSFFVRVVGKYVGCICYLYFGCTCFGSFSVRCALVLVR
jgi:hypothetical protein